MSAAEKSCRWLARHWYAPFVVLAVVVTLITRWWLVAGVILLFGGLWLVEPLDPEGKETFASIATFVFLNLFSLAALILFFVAPRVALVFLVFAVMGLITFLLAIWPTETMRRLGFSQESPWEGKSDKAV